MTFDKGGEDFVIFRFSIIIPDMAQLMKNDHSIPKNDSLLYILKADRDQPVYKII
ncbi:hypothetical protein LOAG_03721 [Loa loa]|uniref:Uncharacterized protein n=1 Tax=Loa loa TaxID=7209 RepID=A0A1S0U3N4_LOALO|nr:hypothetical protein LOAG_03721 [Loa loa]EFO24769.2 hypothetical protein LOAG_03721 [Loa loa]